MFCEHAYLCENEAGSDPDSAGTECECSSKTLTVEDTTSSDDLHGLASHWALVALAERGNSWNEDSGWNISSVSTTLTTLSADHVGAELEALLDVLWVTDHVHVKYTGLVKTVNGGLWWDTDGGNEKTSARLNGDLDQLVKLSLGVVVAAKAWR